MSSQIKVHEVLEVLEVLEALEVLEVLEVLKVLRRTCPVCRCRVLREAPYGCRQGTLQAPSTLQVAAVRI